MINNRGSILGALGIILAIYFFVASTTSRDLVYFVNPVKTAVARVGQSSRVTIHVDEQDITKDVTAAQIAIWNNGKESIREENLLGSGFLSIETVGPEHPIIDAKVLEVSRDEVIKVELDSSKIDDGRLGVKWAILEQDDAVLLQLIYFGDDTTPITVAANVQKPSQVRPMSAGKGLDILFSLMVAGAGAAISVLAVNLGRSLREDGPPTIFKLLQFILASIIVFALVLLIMFLQGWVKPDPPFGL